VKALTLHQVRAWQILYGGKTVENRTWKPNSRIYGQRIAIHAGVNAGRRDVQDAVRAAHRNAPKGKWPKGIVGTVRVLGVLHRDDQGRVTYDGIQTPIARWRALLAAHSRHFQGPYGWVLDRPRALKVPVQTHGHLSLWEREHSHPPRTVSMRQLRAAASASKAGNGTASAG
jgi:hypothetical protein